MVNSANIAFLVEGFFKSNFQYVLSFIYNIIRFFSLSGTYVTVMDYGDNTYRAAHWVQLKNGEDVRKLCASIPKSRKPVRKTGMALQSMLASFDNAPSGNANLLFVITKGKSSDEIVNPAKEIRKRGNRFAFFIFIYIYIYFKF